MLARLDAAIDEIKAREFRRIADAYASPVLINQTLDSGWFRVLAFVGIVALLSPAWWCWLVPANTLCSAR
jgi:hypothetical protein